MTLTQRLLTFPHPYITDVELESLLEGSPDSRYSKTKRLIQQGKLLHIRRGLYCLTEALGYRNKPHSFELAQLIYAPSCISLESALSYHNLIPEAVYTTTSVCTKRSKNFNTPLGAFTFQHLPLENFYIETELIHTEHHRFFIAKPWKAILDYVFCYKKEWGTLSNILESLRIERDDLPTLRPEEIETFDEYYHHRRLTRILKNIQRELKL